MIAVSVEMRRTVHGPLIARGLPFGLYQLLSQGRGADVLRDDVVLAVDGADVHVERNRLEEAAPEAVNLRPAVRQRIPGTPRRGAQLFLSFSLSDVAAFEVDGAGLGVRFAADRDIVGGVQPLFLVAKTQVELHVGRDLPRVLSEQRHVGRRALARTE